MPKFKHWNPRRCSLCRANDAGLRGFVQIEKRSLIRQILHELEWKVFENLMEEVCRSDRNTNAIFYKRLLLALTTILKQYVKAHESLEAPH